jgi:predicted MPP superfamily phosphohydrolase
MKKITLSVAALTIAMMSYGQTNKEQISNQCKRVDIYEQCKNRTNSKSKLCHLHDPNYVKPVENPTVICSGTTKSGNNCKNKTKNISGFCYLHGTKE